MGIKAKIIGVALSASTLAGGAAFMAHEYKGYEPNDVIHVTETCSINNSIGSITCHDVMTPTYNEVSGSLDRRGLMMGDSMVMGFTGICGVFTISGIIRSRRYYPN
jgi:hypothetical protein